MSILQLLFFTSMMRVAEAGYVPGSPVIEAKNAAGILDSDLLDVKIHKALRLLNENHYLGSQPSGGPTYEMDSMRTPEKILKDKAGGGCGSLGLSFAAILIASGVSENDIRIVETSINHDLMLLCPKAGTRVNRVQLSLSGHIFIMVKSGNHWLLINSTAKASESNPDMVSFMSPAELEGEIKKRPVQIPLKAYINMMKAPQPKQIFESGMTILGIWTLSEYPLHDFSARYNLVASGNIYNEICRYGVDAVMQQAKENTEIVKKAVSSKGTATQPSSSTALK